LSNVRAIRGIALFGLLLLSACPKPRPELQFLTISPDNARIAQGDSERFIATGVYTDASTKEMTSEVAWTVDDALVAKVSETDPGLVTAVGPGTSTIRAHFNGVTTSRRFTVFEATVRALEVSPAQPVVPLGLPVDLQVFAIHTDLRVENVTASALFTPADSSVCEVQGARLLGKTAGRTTLTVSYQGVRTTIEVTVTAATVQRLDVQPSVTTLPIGLSERFTATAVLSDQSTLDVTSAVDWSSSASAIAFVTNAGADKGLVVARAKGGASITAALDTLRASAAVTVTDATLVRIEVSPSTASAARGTSATFQATGFFSDGSRKDITSQATWSSSDPTVAGLDPGAPGQARALNMGAATITATLGAQAGSATLTVTTAELLSLEVTPATPTVARGITTALTATGVFSDGSTQDLTQQATWSVGSATTASVSNVPGGRGVVLGLNEGVTEVLAEVGALTGRTSLTVTAALLTALQVTPGAPTLPAGTSLRLTATGIFSDGTTQDLTAQASWASSAPAVVSVSNGPSRGLVLGLARGTSQVSATLQGHTHSVVVTVTNAVLVSLAVSPSPLTLARGTLAALSAIAIYSDNSSAQVTSQATWSSSDPLVASVSNAPGSEGQVQALATGTTQITASLGGVSALAQLTVTPAQLVSLELSPTTATLAAGLTAPFTALGTWTDATVQDLTAQVTWASSNPSVATISNAAGSYGLASAQQAGSTTVSATMAGKTGTASLTVTAARLVSLSITPPALSVSRGTVSNLVVHGTYTDGANLDLTTQVTWASDDAAVATVSNAAGTEGEVRAVGVGATSLTAQLSGVTAQAAITVTPALLTAIELTPVSPTAPVGTTVAFTATGRYSDSTTQDLTTQATWTSSSPLVAAVSNAAGLEGRAQALAQGTATISATANGRTGTATITVTVAALASIALNPSSPRLAQGTPVQLHATGTWTDGSTLDLTSQATWASSDGAVAQLSNLAPTQGRLLAIAAGTATVSATFLGVVGTTVVTVTNATLLAIDLSPSAPTAPAGLTLQLHATGVFSDGSTQDLTDFATWASSDATRASVSNTAGSEGLVSALLVGGPTVSATALGVTGSTTFTVSSALLTSLSVTPASATVPRGLSQAFTATGSFTDGSTADITDAVTWSTSDSAVATISNASGSHGRATGAGVGSVLLTATLSGRSGSASLAVTPAALVSLDVTPVNPTMPLGLGVQLSATGTYTDGSTRDLTAQVTWASATLATAAVSNGVGTQGLVSSTGLGMVSITATLGTISAATQVTVTAAQLVSVGVTPANLTLPLGLQQQLTATGVYTDGSTQNLTVVAAWNSSDAAVAPVSSSPRGQVTALAQGTSTLTATYGGLSGTTLVTVSPAALLQIQVTPPAPALPAGLTLQLTATGLYSDSSTRDLTETVSWGTSNAARVHVSNAAGTRGLIAGVAVGSASVTATDSGVTGSVTVTVTPAVLQQLQVTPANASRPRGVPQVFTATGVYSNGTTQDLTTTATWASSDPAKVAVSNAMGSQGSGSSLNVGAVTIAATHLGITGSTPFTVTPAQLVSLALSPANASVPLGSVRIMQVTGTYTDGTTQNLTSQASFTSSNLAIVSVSNAVGSLGLVSTTAVGSVTISASALGLSASTTMNVTQAALAFIDLTPSGGSTALGYTRQFIAIGTYTDGTTQVLTTQVTWASSDPAKAFISNAVNSRGLLSPVATGVITVSATWSGVTGSTTHTVTPAVLVALVLTPDTFTLPAAATQQVVATGWFSDGLSQDLTTSVTWSSSAPGVAQVSNAVGSHGLVTGIAAGSATITATSGTHSASAAVTVP
jgi:uncharacterized protein YjdB